MVPSSTSILLVPEFIRSGLSNYPTRATTQCSGPQASMMSISVRLIVDETSRRRDAGWLGLCSSVEVGVARWGQKRIYVCGARRCVVGSSASLARLLRTGQLSTSGYHEAHSFRCGSARCLGGSYVALDQAQAAQVPGS